MIDKLSRLILQLCLLLFACGAWSVDRHDEVNLFISDGHQSRTVAKLLSERLEHEGIPYNSHLVDKYFSADTVSTGRNNLNICIGTDATRLVLRRNMQGKTYSALIPEITFHSLLKEFPDAQTRFEQDELHVFYLDQPLHRYLALSRFIGNDIKNIVLFQDEIQQTIDQQHSSNNDDNLNLQQFVLGDEKPDTDQIEKLLASSDVAIIRPSKHLNPQTSKWLLYAAYRNKIPVITFSKAFLDAGSIASLTSDIQSITREIVDNAIALYFDKNRQPSGQYSSDYDVQINASVASFFSIDLQGTPVPE